MFNIKNFRPNLLSIDKISNKNNDAVICNTKYTIMENLDHENLDSENSLCYIFDNADG